VCAKQQNRRERISPSSYKNQLLLGSNNAKNRENEKVLDIIFSKPLSNLGGKFIQFSYSAMISRVSHFVEFYADCIP
jgi:hypothetical protein